MAINPLSSSYREIAIKLENTLEIVNTAPEGEADVSLLEELTIDVVKAVQQRKNLWTTIVSFFYGLVGLVSDYEKLQKEAAQLEYLLAIRSDKDDSRLIKSQLEEKKSEIQQVVVKLNSEIESALLELDQVESQLNSRENSYRKGKLFPSTIISYMEEASNSAEALHQIKDLNARIIVNYQDDPNTDLSIIKTLNDRIESLSEQLTRIRNELLSYPVSEISDSPQKDSVELNKPGGIRNGGNTCYLASGLQTMRVIPAYRKAMDPQQNPLKQREGESDTRFQQRKRIQERGHKLLEKISKGTNVEPQEINRFRDACYQCMIEGEQRVVDSRRNQADSAEALSRILSVLDFDGGTYQIVRTRTPTSVPYAIDGNQLNPAEYSSLEALQTEIEASSATVEVAAYLYMNSEVPLQQLINETWGDEKISAKFVEHGQEGQAVFKQFNSMRLEKKVRAEEFPEVVRITVKQLEGHKATITDTDTVFPFGNGNGPQYRLQAIIEHRPGHYVAHTRDGNGQFIEANDGWVHSSSQTQGGFAYYYVKE